MEQLILEDGPVTEKDLKKLNRYQLLELLIMQTARADELEKQLEEARQQLASKEIRMSELGSIADASVQVGGLLEAAQNTVDLYMKASMRRIDEIEVAALEKADKMISQAYMKAKKIIAETQYKEE